MHKPCYSIEQFRSNFSEKSSINEAITLFQDPKIDLSVAIRATQIDTNWDAKSNSLTGTHKILLLPKLYLSGELYEAPCWQEFTPTGFNGLEEAFLKALRQALASMQRNVPSKGSTPSLKLD